MFTPLSAASATPRAAQLDPVEIARSCIVLGCALALILAGQPLTM